MKKIIFSFILLFLTGLLFAQKTVSFDDFSNSEFVPDENEVKTLFNSFSVNRISGFGGSTTAFSKIGGEFSVLSGGGGGIIINNIFIGGYGEGMANYNNIISSSEHPIIREFGHGGFWLGYEINHEYLIHPVISTRLGWGNTKGYNKSNYFIDKFYVIVPTVSAEVNITRFCKVNLGVEYRQTFGVDNINVTNNDLSNLGVFASLVFGWF